MSISVSKNHEQDQVEIQDYPPPSVPNLPTLSFGFCVDEASDRIPTMLDGAQFRKFTSGRMAIAAALRLLDVKQNDQVFLPAYNCRAMVNPVSWCGAEPVFYRVNHDLSPDFADIRRKIGEHPLALVVVHNFGFPQDCAGIRAFCDQYGLAMIEDCAHAFYGSFNEQAPGSVGDFAISSLMKFFPVFDGGCLASKRHSLAKCELHHGSAGFQLKATLNAIEYAASYKRLRPLGPVTMALMKLKDSVWSLSKRLRVGEKVSSIGPVASDGGYHFDEQWANVQMSVFSQFVMNRSSNSRSVARRRANYNYFLKYLSALPGCRPLFDTLPAGVVPFAFPLFLDDPARVFPRLKMRGIPMFRWEDLDADDCEVSKKYSQHLIQIPCHQELREGELRWIVSCIGEIVGGDFHSEELVG